MQGNKSLQLTYSKHADWKRNLSDDDLDFLKANLKANVPELIPATELHI